jgi:hypothetical protein
MLRGKIKTLRKARTLASSPMELIRPMSSNRRTSSRETWVLLAHHRLVDLQMEDLSTVKLDLLQVEALNLNMTLNTVKPDRLPIKDLNMALQDLPRTEALSLNMTRSMALPDLLHRRDRISPKARIAAPTILPMVRHLHRHTLVPIPRSVVERQWSFPAERSFVCESMREWTANTLPPEQSLMELSSTTSSQAMP